MLVEFRVKNFRSIRDEQVFSMVASNDATLRETHTIATSIASVPRLLCAAVIYGANASGKSNVLRALQFLAEMVRQSSDLSPDQRYGVKPFLLDLATATAPSEFEVTVLEAGIRYQYGFSMTADRILTEYLLVYKNFKPQRWFDRSIDGDGVDRYVYGPGLKGPKTVWQNATRSSSLFLSTAVQLNAQALRPLFDALTNKLVVINENAPLAAEFTANKLRDPAMNQRLGNDLRAADISVAAIEVEPVKLKTLQTRHDLVSGNTSVEHGEIMGNQIHFLHETQRGSARLALSDESSGTRNYLFLLGPIHEILARGSTLVVDELDTSLHPLLVRELVQLFSNPAVNALGAQLIFSTHDSSLLDAPFLLRRDQVWLVEKDAMQATKLYPLLDFSPRKGEALARGYLSGRYGAVPFLQSVSAHEAETNGA